MPEKIFLKAMDNMKFTKKQTDALRMLCQGETNEYIADARGVNQNGLEAMLTTIKHKLKIGSSGSTRVQIVNAVWNAYYES